MKKTAAAVMLGTALLAGCTSTTFKREHGAAVTVTVAGTIVMFPPKKLREMAQKVRKIACEDNNVLVPKRAHVTISDVKESIKEARQIAEEIKGLVKVFPSNTYTVVYMCGD